MAGRARLLAARTFRLAQIRRLGDHCQETTARRGLVLGAYDGCNPGEYVLTTAASKVDEEFGGYLSAELRLGKASVYNNVASGIFAVAVAGLGPQGLGFNENEDLNECKENVRIASGTGARALQDAGVTDIVVESFTNAEAAAEGAALAVWRFQGYKQKDRGETDSTVRLHDDSDVEGWERGIHKAQGQNIARRLEDTPANLMTPEIFALNAIEILCPCGVQVQVRDPTLIEEKKMSAFMALAKNACNPPLLLELSYCGGSEDDKPVLMVGKGTTFDSGGLCLMDPSGMSQYRVDMAGAAVIVGAMKALAAINLPVNVNDGVRTALGDSSTGVFSSSESVWNELRKAGGETGDRLWRLPLWKYFQNKLVRLTGFDMNDIGIGRGGDPCVGAAFLYNFVPPVDFVHLDITGSGMLSAEKGLPYLREGTMSGRPTRTLVQFLNQLVCPMDKGSDC